MELLKLVIVDDESILLQGLIHTYDWGNMGFTVVGWAQSGEQALEVIRQKRPDVVLTDIRMKQITGLVVMEEIRKENAECLFIVLSAYRDFEYARQACKLGAFAYLLKPIEDDKLEETMKEAYDRCMKSRKSEEQYENLEKLLHQEDISIIHLSMWKYIEGEIVEDKLKDVLTILKNMPESQDRFVTVMVEIDPTYKITDVSSYNEARDRINEKIRQELGEELLCWRVEETEDRSAFLIKTRENAVVYQLKDILNEIKNTEEIKVVGAISKPYKGIQGIKRSYEEAKLGLQKINSTEKSQLVTGVEGQEWENKEYFEEPEKEIVNSVRKNDAAGLKEKMIEFVSNLPKQEEQQRQYFHKLMLKTELMLKDTYGMTDELKQQFASFYAGFHRLTTVKLVDVCYKILLKAVELREWETEKSGEGSTPKRYMETAVSYIEEHLEEENLSITQVAAAIYLNPVYFGRVFKNTYQMTFKQYLLRQRMERAKRLLETTDISIGNIGDKVGIGNPSYFSQLFKNYTGKLPSEYKKDYEI